MKITLSLVLSFLISLSILMPVRAQAEIPPKVKAFATLAGYGAAGGALLGGASMAFGADSSAIPKGASLGLYAGILFGAYVLVSHHNSRYGSYDDKSSPYKESSDVYGEDYESDEGGSSDGDGTRGGFFDRMETLQTKGGQKPPFHMNFFRMEF